MSRDGVRRMLAWLALPLLSASAVFGAEAHTWISNAAKLLRGESDGTAISSGGALFAAPSLSAHGVDEDALFPSQVWSAAADAAGNLFLGTGPEGRVLMLTPAGTRREFFAAEGVMVTALAFTADGSLLAGTSPEGLIYRIGPDGEGRVWCDTGERYIWSIAVAASGNVYASTGESGLVLEIGPSGKARTFFDSDEDHLVSLLAAPDGGFWAGGASRGLIYRIDAEGNGLVVYDDALEEARALGLDDRGRVVALLLGGPERESRRPAVRLRLPEGSSSGVDTVVGEFEETPRPEVRGVIEGLPETPEKPGAARTVGRVVRIDAEGRAVELWHSSDEAPFALLRDGDGWLFGTGEPGRLWRIDGDDGVSRLATLREGQLTELIRVGRSVFLATSNALAAYRVDEDRRDPGVFLSEPLDAGGPARWGSLRWRQEGRGGRVEIYTRTGNSQPPDATWSAWSPAMVDPRGHPIVNPDGRFLQWRVRFVGTQRGDLRLSAFEVTYEPYNRPPDLREAQFASGERAFATEATLNWTASDPDRDPVELTLEYRRAGDEAWTPARDARGDAAAGGARNSGRRGLQHGKLIWDTSALEEGDYDVRAVATDETANPPGEEGRTVLDTLGRVTVDRTPPSIEIRAASGSATELVVEDAHSTIARVELIRDHLPRYRLRPQDGVCDSSREIFRLESPLEGDGWQVRAEDAAGNQAEAALASN